MPTLIYRYHGGWLAPNIYFLGFAGCVQVNGIRIAGASGIFQHYDFQKGTSHGPVRHSIPLSPVYFTGQFERVPYDRSTMRSIYHVREYNVRRLSLVSLIIIIYRFSVLADKGVVSQLS